MKSRLRLAWSRLRSAVMRSRLDREFDEELSTHLELLTDDFRRRGLPEPAARREARIRLGSTDWLREEHRGRRGLPMIDLLSQNIRYAIRALRKSPAFTSVVVLSLALGIGANTALFSLVDSLLLRSVAVRDPDRLVQAQIFPAKFGGGFKKPMTAFTREDLARVQETSGAFSEVVGFWQLDRPAMTIDGAIEPACEVERVTVNYFRDLGVIPVAGRAPEASDGDVAIISASWWRSRFGGRRDVFGRSLTVDGRAYTIVGAAPSRFRGFRLESPADVWLSSPSGPNDFTLIGRLKPGVSEAQARGAVHPILEHIVRQAIPDIGPDQEFETELQPVGRGLSQLREQYRGSVIALMALVTLVLLTTCTNVGNLLMLRNGARRRELTVRAALGASRARLAVQYFVESVLLAAAGCLIGLFFARWGVSMIVSMLPLPSAPETLQFSGDLRVIALAVAISLVSALLFGLAPAARATEVDLTGSLRASQGASSSKGARRLGRGLVACQVGLSVLLLVGGGLFVRTLRNLSNLEIGFNVDQVLQVSIDTRFAGYGRNAPRNPREDREGEVGGVFRLLRERIEAISGVSSITGTRNPMMRGANSRMAVDLPGLRRGDDLWDAATIGPGFFETLDIRAVRGRTLDAADFERRLPIYVVNEAFAKQYAPNADLLAQVPGIIGIVPDVRIFDVRSKVRPMMYEMMRREPDRLNALQVRTTGDPGRLMQPIREAVQSVNPRLFVSIRTMRDDLERGIAKERMVATISGFFSLLGLMIASIGIFGVASYTVARRTKELAIRRALGAGRWSVIREALRETIVVFGLGLIAGIATAAVAVRFAATYIQDLLYGLTATDSANITAAVSVMVAVAMAACLLPAYRATRIDPLVGIREE